MIISDPARSSSISADTRKLAVADWIAFVLMIVGAVNWGLVGAFGLDLVALLFGEMTMASRVVYILVGIAGLYGLTMPMRLRRTT